MRGSACPFEAAEPRPQPERAASPLVHCPAMSRALFDSFWRAAAYCLHPKVVALSLAPLLLVGGTAALLGYFFWEPAVADVRAALVDSALLEPVFAWLRAVGGAAWLSVIGPLVIVALACTARTS